MSSWALDTALFYSYIFSITVLPAVVFYQLLSRRGPPPPPGPRGWPLIGSLFDIPQVHPWVAFKEWSHKYDSDIVSFTVLGKPTIIVNSYAAAQDPFSKRSSIYSHRPDMPMVNDLMHWDEWGLGQMQYGPDWKDQRKMFRQEVEFSEATLHRPHVLRAARRFIKNVLNTPDDYFAHLRHMTGFSVLSTAYGIEVKPRGDPLVHLAERAMYAIARAGNFGSYLVDFIPILKYIPTWFPGAQFKRDAREWSKYVKALPDAGFVLAKEKIADGTVKDSLASRVLERIRDVSDEERAHQEHVLRGMLAGFYAAGADTTVSAISTVILAMIHHPDIQNKVQAAIEAAVGKDRLPEVDDLKDIPYLHAVVKEALRWQPVLPLALPHAACKSDVYRGFAIPKGSAVVGLYETMFGSETHLFKPERFLTKDGNALDPSVPHPEMAFGYGRRLCPGRFIAYSTILIASASLLHCFTVGKATDGYGKEVEPSLDYTTGVISFPKPFKCQFKARSALLKELIEEISEPVQ